MELVLGNFSNDSLITEHRIRTNLKGSGRGLI